MGKKLPSKVGSHEAGQSVESKAGVILVVTRDVLTDHVSGQHYHIQTLVERLGRSQVTYTLCGGRGGREGGGEGGRGEGRARGKGGEKEGKGE